MVNSIKKLNLILIIILIICSIGVSSVSAQEAFPNPDNYRPNIEQSDKVVSVFGKIAAAVQIIGIIATVITVVILGIKFMMASVEEKAEIKKSMIPIIVGTIFIAATGTILRIVDDLTNQALK